MPNPITNKNKKLSIEDIVKTIYYVCIFIKKKDICKEITNWIHGSNYWGCKWKVKHIKDEEKNLKIFFKKVVIFFW